jgi:hypothetical protein
MAAQDKPDKKSPGTRLADSGGGAVWQAMGDALDQTRQRLHTDSRAIDGDETGPELEPAVRLLDTWLREDAGLIGSATDDSWEQLKAELDCDRTAGNKLFP